MLLCHLLGAELHPIVVLSERISEGREFMVVPFRFEFVLVPLPNLCGSDYHFNFIFLIIVYNDLKMTINRPIGLVVKVLESDVKAVISLSGELLDFSQAQPQFTW